MEISIDGAGTQRQEEKSGIAETRMTYSFFGVKFRVVFP